VAAEPPLRLDAGPRDPVPGAAAAAGVPAPVEREHRRRFFERANAAYARLKADPEGWADWQDELRSAEHGRDPHGRLGGRSVDRGRRVFARADVWETEFDPTRGREQAGRHPALTVSTDLPNDGPSEPVFALRITGRDRDQPLQVAILSPEVRPSSLSFILCDQPRVLSPERLLRRRGEVGSATVAAVVDRLRRL
jgi:mRNA interferase MazF